jgi:hypothetical protein
MGPKHLCSCIVIFFHQRFLQILFQYVHDVRFEEFKIEKIFQVCFCPIVQEESLYEIRVSVSTLAMF